LSLLPVYVVLTDLHSCPTRRSSDLVVFPVRICRAAAGGGQCPQGPPCHGRGPGSSIPPAADVVHAGESRAGASRRECPMTKAGHAFAPPEGLWLLEEIHRLTEAGEARLAQEDWEKCSRPLEPGRKSVGE